MATETWTEGEPSEDGLYACESSKDSTTFGRIVVVLVKAGAKQWQSGSVEQMPKILRHYRLPEPQQSAEVPPNKSKHANSIKLEMELECPNCGQGGAVTTSLKWSNQP